MNAFSDWYWGAYGTFVCVCAYLHMSQYFFIFFFCAMINSAWERAEWASGHENMREGTRDRTEMQMSFCFWEYKLLQWKSVRHTHEWMEKHSKRVCAWMQEFNHFPILVLHTIARLVPNIFSPMKMRFFPLFVRSFVHQCNVNAFFVVWTEFNDFILQLFYTCSFLLVCLGCHSFRSSCNCFVWQLVDDEAKETTEFQWCSSIAFEFDLWSLWHSTTNVFPLSSNWIVKETDLWAVGLFKLVAHCALKGQNKQALFIIARTWKNIQM